MSLLGRLEDLSLTDIVQIVFLSRRTGILEIVDGEGRHTVLFRNGLIVNASAPKYPDLVAWLRQRGLIPAAAVGTIRKMEDAGIPSGTAAVEMNLISQDGLAAAVKDRITTVVTPLLHSREGEFNFLLAETMKPVDIEYDADALFKEGGFPPPQNPRRRRRRETQASPGARGLAQGREAANQDGVGAGAGIARYSLRQNGA